MFKIFLLLAILVWPATYGKCQTVVWQMQPTDYSQIERISNNLFKVVRNGKIGLINSDGNVVAPIVNDNISDCYEHKALITSNDGHGERITGCLTDDGHYYSYSTAYYTLNGQKFFSDGLLSVSNENGKLGYIDEYGNELIGFDGKYSRIKPFTEGFAAVMRDGKYVLIDKDGNEAKFVFKSAGAAISGCTNVYRGKAYVYNKYGDYYIYDAIKRSALENTSKIKNTTTDYLYCYQSVSGRTKEVPFEKMEVYSGKKGAVATYADGYYTYLSGDYAIVPGQFTSATQFEDDLAIVSINGKLGILKYIDGGRFDISVPTPKHDFYMGNSVLCSFNLIIPSVWHEKNISVTLRDHSGSAIKMTNNSDTYTFSTIPTMTGQESYSISVNGDGLLLYQSQIFYTFNKKEKCETCGKDKNQCEFGGKHPVPDKKETKLKKVVNPCPTCGKGNCKTHCYTCGKTIQECKYQGVH